MIWIFCSIWIITVGLLICHHNQVFLLKRKKNEDFLARKVVCLLLLAPLLEPLCCKLDFVPNLLRCVGPCTTDLAEVSFFEFRVGMNAHTLIEKTTIFSFFFLAKAEIFENPKR